jgi:hypothetical protein
MCAAGGRLATTLQTLLIRQHPPRPPESALFGLQPPSVLHAGPARLVSRLKIKKTAPITATAAAAFSEYIARRQGLPSQSLCPALVLRSRQRTQYLQSRQFAWW